MSAKTTTPRRTAYGKLGYVYVMPCVLPPERAQQVKEWQAEAEAAIAEVMEKGARR